ncbi:MAG: ABC transporter permease [Candidatus Eiseniibacteriota bacterium]
MFLRALTRSLARRPKRFAIAVLAVTMGVGMAVALASVSLVLGDRLGRTVRAYGANIVLLPRGADMPLEVAGTDLSGLLDAGAIPESSLAVLQSFRWRNNILGSAPQTSAIGLVTAAQGGTRSPLRAAVVGTTFEPGMNDIAPWWTVNGRLPHTAEALVGRALAARLGASPGDEITLALERPASAAPAGREPETGPDHERVRVAGVLDAGGFEDDQIYVPLAWLQERTATKGQVERVLVSVQVIPGEAPPMPDPAKDLEAFERWTCRPYALTVSREIEDAMPGVSARPIAQLVRGESRLVGRLNLLMLLLTAAALTAAILGVMSTMVASVVDRTQEIALLRAIGATTPAVARLFLAEALVVAIGGGLLGVALGFGLAQLIGRGAFDTAVEAHPLLLPVGLALAALVCLAGSWLPLRRIGAIDPARALRPGA